MLVVLAVGCGETPGDVLPEPRDGRSGIQLSGTVNGRQVAISEGLPTVNFGDCDVNEGPDRDVCVVTEDFSGQLVVIVFENPEALVEGERLPIDDVACADAQACDGVTGTAIVEVQIGADAPRVRATGGNMTLDVVEPFTRYRGDLDLQLPGGGRLSGDFDLIPRPEELS